MLLPAILLVLLILMSNFVKFELFHIHSSKRLLGRILTLLIILIDSLIMLTVLRLFLVGLIVMEILLKRIRFRLTVDPYALVLTVIVGCRHEGLLNIVVHRLQGIFMQVGIILCVGVAFLVRLLLFFLVMEVVLCGRFVDIGSLSLFGVVLMSVFLVLFDRDGFESVSLQLDDLG